MTKLTAPTNPVIESAEIHLWQLHHTGTEVLSESWLDTLELARVAGFSSQIQSRRYLAFRCAIRRILSSYLDVAPQTLRFSIAAGGKPVISSPDCNLQFNLSHTGDRGLLAVARDMQVGVDLEAVRSLKYRQGIAERVFSPSEIKLLSQTPAEKWDQVFFQLWTCMEARQKCKGKGIFSDKISNQSVGLHQFTPMPGYCGAVAWDDPTVEASFKYFLITPEAPAINLGMPTTERTEI